MAKSKKGASGNPRIQPQESVPNAAKVVGPAISSAKPESAEMKKVGAVAEEENIDLSEKVQNVSVPTSLPPLSLVEAYRQHLAAEKVYVEAKEKIAKKEAALDGRDEKLLEQEMQFSEREEDIKRVELEIDKRLSDLSASEELMSQDLEDFKQKNENLDNWERSLAEKEQDLITGRLSEAFGMYVQPLEEKRSEILSQITEQIGVTQEAVRSQWVKMLNDLDSGNDEFRKDLISRIKELDLRRLELETQQSSIDAEKSRLVQARISLDLERKSMAEAQREELEEFRERLETEYHSRRESLNRREEAANSIIRKNEFITEWEDTLGDIEEVASEISGLKSSVKDLQLELAKRRSMNDENELHTLRRTVADLTDDLNLLRNDYQARERESAATLTRSLEAEAKLDEFDNLQSTIDQYKKQRDQLKMDMDHLSGLKEAESPFSECSSMDREASLQVSATLLEDSVFVLSQFVDQMQWLLYNPLPGTIGAQSLKYRKNDLRVFVAGLNASRLHILEGVSGTGKTTLPIAFVRALGGGDSNVAIQAGWRDRQDLLGYFNEFHKEFRETDFLRGMYRAMTPRHKDGLYFVVLDEMNLSKVEQYFADYLKGLEDAKGADVERGGSIPLMDRSGIAMPRNLQEGKNGGIELPLPPNVWFIGTANQDESTQSFAPKTQSRSHIMELPYDPPSDEDMNKEIGGRTFFRFQPDSLGFATLNNAFRTAELKPENRSNTDKSEKIFAGLRQVIADIDKGLALGPRFDRQRKAFVPIIIETGGTLGLAVDHLVSSKFIRRMNENYKITSTHKKKLSDSLERVWRDNALGDYSDTKSFELLNRDEYA